MLTETRDFTTEDFDYLRHGDRTLKMRLFRPDAPGPHPAIVDLHGGAWNNGDLTGCQGRDEVLAANGLAVAAIDFRQAGDGYPSSLADANYAVRWIKAHGRDLGLDSGRVALCGQSSGGHLAMLAAMRPADPRYAAIALDVDAPGVDATVRCVGMAWPVINPLSRYRHALRARAAGENADWVGSIPESHDRYWVDDDNMSEGNPILILERGETVALPPALWVQGRPDIVHDYRDPESPIDANEPERFAADYRKAGGEIEVVEVPQKERATRASWDPLAAFFRKHLG